MTELKSIKSTNINIITKEVNKLVQEINKKEPFLSRQDEERAIRKATSHFKEQSAQNLNNNFTKSSLKSYR